MSSCSPPLTSAIQSLETGLETFSKRATEAASVCETFEQRLGRLGNEMKPLERYQRLALARKNLDLAMVNIKELRKLFEYEAEARIRVSRGYNGAAERATYIKLIKEIQVVEEYFRSWTTLKLNVNPLGRLAELRKEALETCLAEFRGFVEGIGPSVEYSPLMGVYELVDTILLEETLRDTLLWLSSELPCSHEEIQEVYAEERSKLSSHVMNDFHQRFGGISREDRGDTSVPLGMFLDFLVKHFILEKLLLDRIFPMDSSRCVIESVLRPVTGKLQEVAKRALRSTVKEGGEMAWERNAEVMVSMFKVLDEVHCCVYLIRPATQGSDALNIQLTSVLTKTAEALKQSCVNFVKSVESDSETKFFPSNAAVQAIVSGTVNTIRRVVPFRESYNKVFMNIVAPMPWDNTDDDSDIAACETPPDKTLSEDIRYPRFARFVDHVFQKLIESVTRMYSPSHLGGSDVANLAVQHISYINNLSYIQTRVHASPTSPSFSPSKAAFVGPSHSPLGMSTDNWFEKISILNLNSRRAKAIMVITDRCPSPKAAEMPQNSIFPRTRRPSVVKREAVNTLFQSESLSHSAVNISDNSSDGPASSTNRNVEFAIAEYMTSNTRRTISIELNKAVETYYDIALDPMVKAIEDNVTDLEVRRSSSGSSMLRVPLKSGRKELKKKFGNWNEMWEGLCTAQLGITILDNEIMEDLRSELRERLLVPYESVYEKYHNVQFSRKHQQEYVRFSPSDVSSGIDAMFSGVD